MHRYAFILAILAILGFTGQSLRATSVPIGVGNNVDCLPFGCAGSAGITEYQQVYSSSSFGPAPLNIAAVSFFRNIDPTPTSVTSGIYTISFSTTTAGVGSLNSNLSQNFGIFGSQLFFSGALSGPVGAKLTIGGNGATPVFNYNPLLGNLLLDISISGAAADTGIAFDSENFSSLISRAASGIVDPNPQGLVTMFSDVPPPIVNPTPEPGSMLLFGTGLLAVLRYARKKS